MKEGLIPSRYECPKCKKDMRLVERKGTTESFEWRRVQSKEYPHCFCRSVRKGGWVAWLVCRWPSEPKVVSSTPAQVDGFS
ncbi:hypothetical protein TNCV_527091 [Trichonephila clavipes]|nr:hypothetical protein TNCV_527091 [Trichonephila clavipes]